MLSNIHIAIDCADVAAQADFWCAALGYRRRAGVDQYQSLEPADGGALPRLVLQQVDDPAKTAKNKLHLDLIVGDEIEAEAQRLVKLGATQQGDAIDEAGTRWIVMADPEGNEFCLCVR